MGVYVCVYIYIVFYLVAPHHSKSTRIHSSHLVSSSVELTVSEFLDSNRIGVAKGNRPLPTSCK